MPSQPVTFPATSSTLPYPSRFGSRFSAATRISALACALSCSPDVVQAWEPVRLPIAAWGRRKRLVRRRVETWRGAGAEKGAGRRGYSGGKGMGGTYLCCALDVLYVRAD